MKLKPPKQQQKKSTRHWDDKVFWLKNEITGGSVIWFDETLVKKEWKTFAKLQQINSYFDQ